MQGIVVALLCVVRTGEVDLLVEGLHDPDFAVREVAAAKIERLGSWGVLGLVRGLRHGDPEVRHRCVRLLKLARRSDLEVGLDALLDAPERPEVKRLPGWERFRRRYGQELDARSLYAAMMRADPRLSLALDGNQEHLRQIYGAAETKIRRVCRVLPRRSSIQEPPNGDVAGLLTLVMFVSVEYPECVPQPIWPTYISLARAQCDDHFLDSTVFRRLACEFLRGRDVGQITDAVEAAQDLGLMALVEPDLKQQIRRLTADLASQAPDPIWCHYILTLTHKFGLDETRAEVLAVELPRLLNAYPSLDSGKRSIFWKLLDRDDVLNRPEVTAFAVKLLRDRTPNSDPKDRVRAIEILHRLGRYDLAGEIETLLSDASQFTAEEGVPRTVDGFALDTLIFWSGGNPSLCKFPQEATPVACWRQYQADRKVQSAANAAALQADPRGTALLRQLGSDAWTTREQAVERLRRFGPRAAPLLRAGLEDADPEVVDRCRRLLEP